MRAIRSPPSPRCRRRSPSRRSALIKVEYKVLPHVIDVAEAMKPDAPILHDHMLTEGVNPPPTKPSNIAKRIEFNKGDAKAGFAEAEVVVERDYTTQAVHQGYIEPHAALASAAEDGQVQVWSTTQGHFQVRGFCAKLLNLDTSQIRVTPTEIGGGFGGKTVVYLEPLAIRLSQKIGQAGEDDHDARGGVPRLRPGAGRQRQGQDRRQEGRPHRRRRVHRRDAGGRLPGLAGRAGLHVLPTPATTSTTSTSIGFDVVSNRPKVAAYRAPGAPISAWAVESTHRHPGAAARAWIRSTCA